jgi:putative NADH-flavin reductase
MQITVFGANGKVGSKVVAGLLARGYRVRAFVRDVSTLESRTNLTIVQGDVRNKQDVTNALKNSTVVICALGSWSTKSKDILSAGMTNIIPAMQAQNIERIVSLTGAEARDKTDQPKLINKLSHFMSLVFLRKILQDGERHIALLRGSDLNWSVLRSPLMKTKGKRGFMLKITPIKPWVTISRDDVAEAMIELALNNQFTKSAPYICRG